MKFAKKIFFLLLTTICLTGCQHEIIPMRNVDIQSFPELKKHQFYSEPYYDAEKVKLANISYKHSKHSFSEIKLPVLFFDKCQAPQPEEVFGIYITAQPDKRIPVYTPGKLKIIDKIFVITNDNQLYFIDNSNLNSYSTLSFKEIQLCTNFKRMKINSKGEIHYGSVDKVRAALEGIKISVAYRDSDAKTTIVLPPRFPRKNRSIVYRAKNGLNGQNGKAGRNGYNGRSGNKIRLATRETEKRYRRDKKNRRYVKTRNGLDGRDGADGRSEEDGFDGEDGRDAYNGAKGRNGADGEKGGNGHQGKAGKSMRTLTLKISALSSPFYKNKLIKTVISYKKKSKVFVMQQQYKFRIKACGAKGGNGGNGGKGGRGGNGGCGGKGGSGGNGGDAGDGGRGKVGDGGDGGNGGNGGNGGDGADGGNGGNGGNGGDGANGGNGGNGANVTVYIDGDENFKDMIQRNFTYALQGGKSGSGGKKAYAGARGIAGVGGRGGEGGDAGEFGYGGKAGLSSKDGRNSYKGRNGKDGFRGKSGANGQSGRTGTFGKDGVFGKDGRDGSEGKITYQSK